MDLRRKEVTFSIRLSLVKEIAISMAATTSLVKLVYLLLT